VPAAPLFVLISCSTFVPPHLHTNPRPSFLLLLRHHSPPTGDLRHHWPSAGAHSPPGCRHSSLLHLSVHKSTPHDATPPPPHRRPPPWVSSSTLTFYCRPPKTPTPRRPVQQVWPSPLTFVNFFLKIFGFNSRTTHLIIVSDVELLSMGFNLWL